MFGFKISTFFSPNPQDYLVTKAKILSKYLHVLTVLITFFFLIHFFDNDRRFIYSVQAKDTTQCYRN